VRIVVICKRDRASKPFPVLAKVVDELQAEREIALRSITNRQWLRSWMLGTNDARLWLRTKETWLKPSRLLENLLFERWTCSVRDVIRKLRLLISRM
jgi:hypothetical protein